MVKTACSVGAIDTTVAVMSGFFIFPAVFSVSGVEANAGPGLVFITLPNVFNMAFHSVPVVGYVFTVLFYLLLLLAALTSSISLHESVTVYAVESLRMTRSRASIWVSVLCMSLGVLCVYSFGPLSDFKLLGLTVFDLFDFVSSKILLPLGGIVICLFTGWYLDKRLVLAEVTNEGRLRFKLFRVYMFLVKYVVPVAIAAIFVNELI